MASDSAGTSPRKPPPAPSTRKVASRLPSIRPSRRVTNPPAKPALGRAANSSVHSRVGGKSAATASVLPAESDQQSIFSSLPLEQPSPVVTSALRDELVRAMMPELRVLIAHLVDNAIERALTPLVQKQGELAAALKDLRDAQTRLQPPSVTAPQRSPEPAAPTPAVRVEARPLPPVSSPTRPSETVTLPVTATVDEHPAMRVPARVVAAPAYDPSALADIPLELDGSRRKKAIVWIVGTVVMLFLLSMMGISALSHLGTHL